MIRRAVWVAVAAVALSLSPSVALAYSSPPISFTAVDSPPAIGVPFTVHTTGAKSGEKVTLTMTREPASTTPGGRSVTKTADARGVVDFEVTLTEEGKWTLVSTSASGAVLGTQSVTVSDGGSVIVAGEGAVAGTDTGNVAGTGTGAVAGSSDGAGNESQLSNTGFQGMGLALGGGVFILAGAGALFLGRRRKPHQMST